MRLGQGRLPRSPGNPTPALGPQRPSSSRRLMGLQRRRLSPGDPIAQAVRTGEDGSHLPVCPAAREPKGESFSRIERPNGEFVGLRHLQRPRGLRAETREAGPQLHGVRSGDPPGSRAACRTPGIGDTASLRRKASLLSRRSETVHNHGSAIDERSDLRLDRRRSALRSLTRPVLADRLRLLVDDLCASFLERSVLALEIGDPASCGPVSATAHA